MVKRFKAVPGRGIVASSSIKAGYSSWNDAYEEFEKIVNRYFPDEDKIESEVDKFCRAHKDDPMVQEAYRRWEPDIDDLVTDEELEKVWEIAERYNSSRPLSGDWSTETKHEMNAIAKELNISKSLAKKIMIDELGFDEDMF